MVRGEGGVCKVGKIIRGICRGGVVVVNGEEGDCREGKVREGGVCG